MIRRVTVQEILDATDLLAEYDAECSTPEMGEIDPQAALYEAMQASGAMQCFGAFDDDGVTLVGFASVLVYVVPHYGRKAGLTESIFVTKTHRGSPAGVELIAAVEDYARDAGCKAFYFSAPAGGAFEAYLRFRGNCRRSNVVYVEAL